MILALHKSTLNNKKYTLHGYFGVTKDNFGELEYFCIITLTKIHKYPNPITLLLFKFL